MTVDDVIRDAFAMPLTSPAFPPGPYRFVNREFLVVTYRTDLDALLAVVPEPLQVTEPIVKYEFIRSTARKVQARGSRVEQFRIPFRPGYRLSSFEDRSYANA